MMNIATHYSGGNSVEEVGGGGKALRISDKFVLILHIFFNNHGKYENDKNDFYKHNHMSHDLGAVHMSRASPVNRTDSILSSLMEA